MRNIVLTGSLRILIVLLAICMGWGFWLYIVEGIEMALPLMLGYIYVVIELARFKKWALALFSTTFILSILISILFMAILGLEITAEVFVDYLLGAFVFVSAISMLTFGICALVRWFLKKE